MYSDYREATISYDYEERFVELYFTRKNNYDTCIKRNPNYALDEELRKVWTTSC